MYVCVCMYVRVCVYVCMYVHIATSSSYNVYLAFRRISVMFNRQMNEVFDNMYFP
jgi:hypothetical protein